MSASSSRVAARNLRPKGILSNSDSLAKTAFSVIVLVVPEVVPPNAKPMIIAMIPPTIRPKRNTQLPTKFLVSFIIPPWIILWYFFLGWPCDVCVGWGHRSGPFSLDMNVRSNFSGYHFISARDPHATRLKENKGVKSSFLTHIHEIRVESSFLFH